MHASPVRLDGELCVALALRFHAMHDVARDTDADGNPIDVAKLEQGTEFIAEVTVVHPGMRSWYENLALSQVFPSGWEINNLRLTGDEEFTTSGSATPERVVVPPAGKPTPTPSVH